MRTIKLGCLDDHGMDYVGDEDLMYRHGCRRERRSPKGAHEEEEMRYCFFFFFFFLCRKPDAVCR